MQAEIKIDDFFKCEALYIQNGFACGDWNDAGKGIIQLRPFNITENGEIDLSAIKCVEVERDLHTYILEADDVIFNNTNSEVLVGKTALWRKSQKAVLSNHMTIVRVLKEDLLSPQFLAFYLHKKWMDGYFHQVCRRHVNQASVSIERLKDTPFPDYAISEQLRIAHVLTTVQTAIEQQARLIALTRELKSALMHKLFTEGLRGEKQKETEIGLVPESWDVSKIREAVEYIDYGYSAPIPKTDPENGIKIVSTADINRVGELLYWKIRRTIAPEKTVKRLTLIDGDVLFNWRNSAELIGKTTVFEQQPEPHIFASFVLRIRCDEKKTHNYFLKHLLNYYREQEVFVKLSRRAVNQANYNRNEILELNIPFPKYEEQCEIAETIGAVESKILLHESKKQLLEELFRTLLHQLMTGQIRVNEFDFPLLGS